MWKTTRFVRGYCPPSAFPLMSVAAIKDALGLGSETSDQSVASSALYATALLEDYLDRRLPLAARVEEFRDVCAQRLLLSAYPIVSVEGVSINGSAVLMDSMQMSPIAGCLYNVGGQWDASVILVTYTGGYDEDEIPPPLQDVFLSLSSSYLNRGAGSGGGTVGMVKSVSIPEAIAVTFETSTGSSSTSGVSGSSYVPADLSPYAGILLPYTRFNV